MKSRIRFGARSAVLVTALVAGACGASPNGGGSLLIGGAGSDALGGIGGSDGGAGGQDSGVGADGASGGVDAIAPSDGGGGGGDGGGLTDVGGGGDAMVPDGGATGADGGAGVDVGADGAPTDGGAGADVPGPDAGDSTPGDADGGPAPCVPGGCDDDDPCTEDACVGGICASAPIPGCCSSDGACAAGTLCEGATCIPACDAVAIRGWSEGCEHWALDLDLYDDAAVLGPTPGVPSPPDAPWGVAISNPWAAPAHLVFTSGDPAIQAALDGIAPPVVPAGSTQTWELPSMGLTGPGVTQSAIRITSDQPVAVVQRNPLDLAGVASSDSSLLLPTHLLGTDHYAASQPTTPDMPFGQTIPGQRGTLTIVAVAAGSTSVTVTPTVALASGPGVPAVPAGVPHTFTLQHLDVLALEAEPPPLAPGAGGDLTGTRVTSNQPVAVFSGHEEATVAPPGAVETCCADHLEEQLLPVSLWGTQVFAAKTHPRGNDPDTWRVTAGVDGVALSTTPAIPGLDGQSLAAGQTAEASTTESFVLSATGPVQVMQYTVGGKIVSTQIGDPALITAVPTASFRAFAFFDVPATYTEGWVSLVRQAGATVLLDGAPVTATAAAVVGQQELVYLAVTPGPHRLESTSPFGGSLYGWHKTSSYGHPLGFTAPP